MASLWKRKIAVKSLLRISKRAEPVLCYVYVTVLVYVYVFTNKTSQCGTKHGNKSGWSVVWLLTIVEGRSAGRIFTKRLWANRLFTCTLFISYFHLYPKINYLLTLMSNLNKASLWNQAKWWLPFRKRSQHNSYSFTEDHARYIWTRLLLRQEKAQLSC